MFKPGTYAWEIKQGPSCQILGYENGLQEERRIGTSNQWAAWTLMTNPSGLKRDKRPEVIFLTFLLLLFMVDQGQTRRWT